MQKVTYCDTTPNCASAIACIIALVWMVRGISKVTLNGMGPMEKSMMVEVGMMGKVLSTPVLHEASA